jgi:hypothetical protein
VGTPFQLGDAARPRLTWFSPEDERDTVIAEHHGYERLPSGPVLHVRIVTFDRRERFWLVKDSLAGAGTHDFRFVFHAAPGREVKTLDAPGVEMGDGEAVEIVDNASGARLVVASLDDPGNVHLEPRWSSRDYGSKVETVAAVWGLRATVPLRARWLLLPLCAGEDAVASLELALKSLAGAPDESDASGV